MALDQYFKTLLERVETSDEITNAGKDKDGFFKPTRAVLIQRLHLLKDLHGNPRAKPMVREAWNFVTESVPAEWLIADSAQKAELKRMLE